MRSNLFLAWRSILDRTAVPAGNASFLLQEQVRCKILVQVLDAVSSNTTAPIYQFYYSSQLNFYKKQ